MSCLLYYSKSPHRTEWMPFYSSCRSKLDTEHWITMELIFYYQMEISWKLALQLLVVVRTVPMKDREISLTSLRIEVYDCVENKDDCLKKSSYYMYKCFICHFFQGVCVVFFVGLWSLFSTHPLNDLQIWSQVALQNEPDHARPNETWPIAWLFW